RPSWRTTGRLFGRSPPSRANRAQHAKREGNRRRSSCGPPVCLVSPSCPTRTGRATEKLDALVLGVHLLDVPGEDCWLRAVLLEGRFNHRIGAIRRHRDGQSSTRRDEQELMALAEVV